MSEWPTTGVGLSARNLILYFASSTFVVTITSPTEAQSVTTAEVPVVWTFAPGTQSSYRVRVYENDETTLVYDSGVIASGTPNHTVPAGILIDGTTYKILVNVTTTIGNAGASDFRSFVANFATSVDVTGVTLRGFGGACEGATRDQLPGIEIGWAQVVPGGSEAFVQYDVARRLAGSSDSWVRVAEITDVATVRFRDYCISSARRYEYRVLWEATDGGDTLLSAAQSPAPSDRVDFDWLYIHDTADPTNFVAFFSFDWDLERPIDRRVNRSWGRQAGTMFIGNQDFHRLSIEALPDVQRGVMWERIADIVTEERTAGVTLCARPGRDRERYFCNVETLDRSNSQRTHTPRVSLVEVHHVEDLATA